MKALNWYRSLTANQKIALKELSLLICGVSWIDLSLIFTPRERIEILHSKLSIEGFNV